MYTFIQFITEMAAWNSQEWSSSRPSHEKFADKMVDNWEFPGKYQSREVGFRQPTFDADLAQAYFKTRYPNWYKRTGGVTYRTIPPKHEIDPDNYGIKGQNWGTGPGSSEVFDMSHTGDDPEERLDTIAHELTHNRDHMKGATFDHSLPYMERPHEIRAFGAGRTAKYDFQNFHDRLNRSVEDKGYHGVRHYIAKKMDEKHGAGTYDKHYKQSFHNQNKKKLLDNGWKEGKSENPQSHFFTHPKHGMIEMNDEGDMAHSPIGEDGRITWDRSKRVNLHRVYGHGGPNKQTTYQYLNKLHDIKPEPKPAF